MKKLEEPLPLEEVKRPLVVILLAKGIKWLVILLSKSITVILIRLTPHKRFSINTRLTIDEAVRILSAITTETSMSFWGMPPSGKIYVGRISAEGFQINRISSSVSFAPVLNGKFIEMNDGVRIDIHMELNPVVTAFMITVSFPILLVLLFFIYNGITTRTFGMDTLLFFGMLVYGQLIFQGGFWIEVANQQKIMPNLFKKTNH